MLKQKYKLAAVVICLLFFFLALFSSTCPDWRNLKYSGNGILADEIPHIGGGYYYLKTHRYFLNPEHPPLVKDIAGAGIALFLHPRPAFPNITNQTALSPDYHRPEYPFQNTDFPKTLEWQNNQDHFGVLFLFHPENDPDNIAFYARLAVIFTNTLLLFILFVLLSRLWSERAALLGLFFFTVSPFSIGHASYVVIDFMSAVLTIIAIASFALYLKKYAEGRRTLKYFFLTAIFFTLALLSKFSSVVLLPAAFLGGLVFVGFVGVGHLRHLRNLRGEKSRVALILRYLGAYAALMVAVVFLISIFYALHIYKAEDYVLIQKLHENYPEEQLPQFGHKILEWMAYSNVLFKGLAAYVNGVFMVISRMVVSAQITYFMGHVYGQEGAGWWYFPILYLAKLSPGFHLFSLITLFLVIYTFLSGKREKLKNKFSKFIANPLPLLLWVFIVSYMAITLSSTFQIGLRHIMPVILAISLLVGRGMDLFWAKRAYRKIKVQHIFAIVAPLMLVSTIFSFPYYLEYYNVFAGGTDRGYKIATDSNYDWGGSDVRRLAAWMRDNNVREIYTQIFADVPLRYYLGDGQKFFNLQNEGKLPSSGSYLAVSNYELMNNLYSTDIPPERKYTILENNLVARVGKTIFVYQVP